MKKTFILLIILILGIKSYSQTLVTLDSIVEKTEANPFVVRTFFIYSDLDDSISSIIVEKGILLDVHDKAFLFDTVPAIDNIEFPLEIESFIYLPIHNEAFDTILYFGSTDATILLQSYLITGSVTDIRPDAVKIGMEINISSDKYPISLSVIDLFGREVLRKEINSNKAIDLGSLKKGTYILKLKHKDAIVNRKIIKK